jgi:hypothetical protein
LLPLLGNSTHCDPDPPHPLGVSAIGRCPEIGVSDIEHRPIQLVLDIITLRARATVFGTLWIGVRLVAADGCRFVV